MGEFEDTENLSSRVPEKAGKKRNQAEKEKEVLGKPQF